jgi:hypothetical protein
MSIVTKPALEASAFVQDTVQTAYVDLVLDLTLPGCVQNDHPSRDFQMRSPSE